MLYSQRACSTFFRDSGLSRKAGNSRPSAEKPEPGPEAEVAEQPRVLELPLGGGEAEHEPDALLGPGPQLRPLIVSQRPQHPALQEVAEDLPGEEVAAALDGVEHLKHYPYHYHNFIIIIIIIIITIIILTPFTTNIIIIITWNTPLADLCSASSITFSVRLSRLLRTNSRLS